MSEKKKDDVVLPKWSKGINLDSIKKSLKAGVIYPTLKPQINRVYKVLCLSESPKEITTELGSALAIDIEYEQMKYSLIIPESFKYQLTVECLRKDVDNLANHTLTFQKTKQKHKQYGQVEMYTVQLD